MTSYQHLLLALIAGLLLCLTAVPSVAVLMVTGAQMWRLRVIRMKGTQEQVPNPHAAWHARSYFRAAQHTLLLLACALLIGLGMAVVQSVGENMSISQLFGEKVLYTQVSIGVALLVSLVRVGTAYAKLNRDPVSW